MTAFHAPVLVDAVLRHAGPARRVVDGTVGGGGHAAHFLEAGSTVLAIDCDPEALAVARARLGATRVTYLEGAFAAPDVIAAVESFGPDTVLLDLGVSSHQIDDASRGFTFRPGTDLDMRMSPAGGQTAAEVLNSAPVEQLAQWFRDYADERRGRRLARTIVERRARAALRTSDDFVGAIRRALGPNTGPSDFARLFQAIRIVVNDELGQLGRALPAFRDSLTPAGRILVITYHSGEDRLVKHAFRSWSQTCICPPRQPICTCRGQALGSTVTKRGIRPTADEIEMNSRARSATLRVFEAAV